MSSLPWPEVPAEQHNLYFQLLTGQLRYSARYAGESNLPHKTAEITADKVKFTILMRHACIYSLSQIRRVVGLWEGLVPE